MDFEIEESFKLKIDKLIVVHMEELFGGVEREEGAVSSQGCSPAQEESKGGSTELEQDKAEALELQEVMLILLFLKSLHIV